MGRVKKAKKQVRTQKTADEPRKARLYIIGDSPLVEEYAELCAAHGYEVCYEWNEPPEAVPDFTSRSLRRTRTIPHEVSLALELTMVDHELKRRNIQALDKALDSTAAILSSSVTVSATEQATWVKNRTRLVGMSALPTLSGRPLMEVAPTVFSPKEAIEVVQRFLRSIGKEMILVQDRVGMVFPRMLCHTVNEAAFALQEQIVAPRDLDTALKLGADFPVGPIEWADRIGWKHVLAVLSALQRDLQEERYRIAPLLRQLALGGVWWKRT